MHISLTEVAQVSDRESMILKAAKSELSMDQRLFFDQEYEKNKKSMLVAYLLLVFLGGIGIHHFYLKKVGFGILYIFTGALLGVGWLIDLFITPKRLHDFNERIAKDAVIEVRMLKKGEGQPAVQISTAQEQAAEGGQMATT
jgi:TM2 domain-containing membrane protein YozV